jgi:hypothetical protein
MNGDHDVAQWQTVFLSARASAQVAQRSTLICRSTVQGELTVW